MLIKALNKNSNKISQTTTNTPKVEINILTQSFWRIENLLFITQNVEEKKLIIDWFLYLQLSSSSQSIRPMQIAPINPNNYN